MKNWIYVALLMISGFTYGQDSSKISDHGRVETPEKATDTMDRKLLPEVVVQAFEQNRRLSDVPAAIGVITNAEWNRYSKMSIVPAMNSIPGVRMEERSPGSYRFSFRGSTLRSPFGVRNIKVYLNGVPFTDPGGNTYITQLAPFDMYSLEAIKG
ncbi:MAG TPA: Plug domain-containing protein, partial [Puia sp.]